MDYHCILLARSQHYIGETEDAPWPAAKDPEVGWARGVMPQVSRDQQVYYRQNNISDRPWAPGETPLTFTDHSVPPEVEAEPEPFWQSNLREEASGMAHELFLAVDSDG